MPVSYTIPKKKKKQIQSYKNVYKKTQLNVIYDKKTKMEPIQNNK